MIIIWVVWFILLFTVPPLALTLLLFYLVIRQLEENT